MKRKEIIKQAKISKSFLSQILSGIRRPSWSTAKTLAIVTNTTPELWLDGSPEEIRAKIQVSA